MHLKSKHASRGPINAGKTEKPLSTFRFQTTPSIPLLSTNQLQNFLHVFTSSYATTTIINCRRSFKKQPHTSYKKTSKNGLSRNDKDRQSAAQLLVEGPSCIFVGPIERASQETLEAFYRQAQDSYYSGKPLIVDDMFDRLEVILNLVFNCWLAAMTLYMSR
ncbi:putative PGR5-like protein [Helianthus anomalus]